MITIFKGSNSPETAIALAAGFNYNGSKLVAEYQSSRREFSNIAAGMIVRLAFSSSETERFAVGTYPLSLTLVGPDGRSTDIGGTALRIRVTCNQDEVTEGVSLVLSKPEGGNAKTVLADVDGVPESFTDNQLRAKVNEIIGKLGGTVTAIAVSLLLPFGAIAANVTTAKKGEIQNTQTIVTSVDLSGLATTGQLETAIQHASNSTNFYTKTETEQKIIELSPPPGNYNAVSNAAMSSVSESRATAIAEDVVAARPILLADTQTNLVYILKAERGLGDGGFYFYAYTNDTSVVNH
ncbi:MAG: hypothetical protein ACI4Q3_00640 [Kiritimatiellia bacterium]